jgi:hypothetical protein
MSREKGLKIILLIMFPGLELRHIAAGKGNGFLRRLNGKKQLGVMTRDYTRGAILCLIIKKPVLIKDGRKKVST